MTKKKGEETCNALLADILNITIRDDLEERIREADAHFKGLVNIYLSDLEDVQYAKQVPEEHSLVLSGLKKILEQVRDRLSKTVSDRGWDVEAPLLTLTGAYFRVTTPFPKDGRKGLPLERLFAWADDVVKIYSPDFKALKVSEVIANDEEYEGLIITLEGEFTHPALGLLEGALDD